MKKIGILGSGQLALYLCQSIRNLGHQSVVLANSPEDPALGSADYVYQREQLEEFLDRVDVLSFENEFFSNEILELIAEKNIPTFPSLGNISLLKNKYQQKLLCQRLSLATASFSRLEKEGGLKLRNDSVLKYSHGAYDGKGLLMDSSDSAECQKFLQNAWSNQIDVYQEDKISFDKELAIQCAFHKGNLYASFPLVETQQTQGYCKWVLPFDEGNTVNLQKEATKMAQKIAHDLSYTGLFAVEFFYNRKEQSLWINELAPRVHNSGHYTMDAFDRNQFDLHLSSYLEGAQGPIQISSKKDVLMMNLIAPYEKSLESFSFESEGEERVYWYQKKKARLHRKMGHINLEVQGEGASNMESAKKYLLGVEERLWREQN